MTRRHAIVIAVDGLRASALGAYGNTTYPTPALDALAARSRLVDWMWCTGPDVKDFYRAAWQGQKAETSSTPPNKRERQSLFEVLEQVGVASSLITDDPAIAASAEQLPLTEIRRIEVAGDRSAETIEDTGLAQLFTMAMDQIVAWGIADAAGESTNSRLLWLHARGFRASWDAPSELRQQLLDEDDLTATDIVQPPDAANSDDSDELLQFRAAYAAQVMVLDACIEVLMSAIEESGLNEHMLVVLVGCRGFALGEHGAVGREVRSLYSEQLHVPCLIRHPNVEAPPPRMARLTQPTDLYALIRDWFVATNREHSGEPSGPLDGNQAASAPPSCIYSVGDGGEQAIRTPAWLLRRPPGGAAGGAAFELYAKPFDRWEANEIAARRADVAERLLAILDALSTGRPPAPLDADLVEPAD